MTFTAAAFAQRVKDKLPLHPTEQWGDFNHNPHLKEVWTSRDYKPASILMPVIDRPSGASVLFTYRSAKLKNHSGQVSFPGGKIDPDDISPVHAALRELEEEVGISADNVSVVGACPEYRAGSGYDIHPIIGILPPDLPLILSEAEVESVFEVPLAFLMDETNAKSATRTNLVGGLNVNYYHYTYDGHKIWGITAGIVNNIRSAFCSDYLGNDYVGK